MTKDKAKAVLLYGDSFFWGMNPATGTRFNYSERIGGQLQAELGNDFTVVEEGLRGRTMFGENGWFPERDGLAQFGPIFASQLPIDTVVIMLGTNDLNSKTQHTPIQIAAALHQYQEKMMFWCGFMNYPLPRVLVVAPLEIDIVSLATFKEVFEGSAEYVSEVAQELNTVSQELGYTFLDPRNDVASKGTDGIHITPDQNQKLAKAIAEQLGA